MDSTAWIVLAVVVIVLVAVLALIVISARRKSRSDDHARAQQLRDKAQERAGDLDSERAVAAEAERRAEEARRAAAEAERQAADAHTSVAQEEALLEDRVRAADRLDPEVDHKADDYTPTDVAPADAQTDAQTDTSTEQSNDSPPSLPRRTRGAQEMPGQQLESDWGDNYFKRRDSD